MSDTTEHEFQIGDRVMLKPKHQPLWVVLDKRRAPNYAANPPGPGEHEELFIVIYNPADKHKLEYGWYLAEEIMPAAPEIWP